MAYARTCKARNDKGQPCAARPMRDSDYCVFHDPEHAEVVLEARRAGGQRRKKEAAVATAYDFQGLTSIEDIRRLLEVAAYDALSLNNDLGRVRALGYLAQVACTLLEKGETEERLAAVEAALGPRLVKRRDRAASRGVVIRRVD
jgi:hypothetical protein